ncbi:MAG: ribosomal protein S12 methylthiotransferase [Myxococcota bacterium]
MEATALAMQGVVELNLVSQDSTAYGKDLGTKTGLGDLLRALATVDGIQWIRLHYAYPIGIPEGLLEALRDEPKVVPYLDMPLQHASGPMLKAMRRGVKRAGQERILERIHQAVPDVSMRTTFIVGFPGETDEDFAELCDFVRDQEFDHVGVFTYFQEDGTPAALLPDQVDEDVKIARQAEIMRIQAGISRKKLHAHVGMVLPVLIEGTAEESDLLLRGRTWFQAPDVDGQVYINSAPEDVQIGQIRAVRITEAGDYDLVGEVVGTLTA